MKWIEPTPNPYSPELLQAAGGYDLLAQLLWNRGIRSAAAASAFLDPEYYYPAAPHELSGMGAAIREILEAIRAKKLIGVWGDFDVDGQTATTLLVSALKQLGGRVDYHIPIRATESHGIKLPFLEKFLKTGIQLLVTCDTGISEHEGINHARARGVKVVITDHHDLPRVLPEAEAILNPKLLVDEHPLAQLPGVGVAYKLAEGLFTEVGKATEVEQFLDLVALGIVADVAQVRADTRFLLQRGIVALRSTRRLGLRLLFEVAEIEQAYINEEDIGFSIGPRLNAMGRLGDANSIVEFLTTEEESRAAVIAHQLEGLNAERKVQTDHVFRAAMEKLEGQPQFGEMGVAVVEGEKWPAGVIGLVAGRLSSRLNKPAIVLSRSAGEILTGSARSVEGVDISAAIRACDDLLLNFGGHPMAAGLSLKSENLPAFRRRLNRSVDQQTGGVLAEPELRVDHVLGLDQIDLAVVMGLERLAPYGSGNPQPVFGVINLKLISHSMLGRSKIHRQMIVEDKDGNREKILWWFGSEEELPLGPFDLAFTAGVNRFRGEVGLQLSYVDTRHSLGVGGSSTVDQDGVKVIDLRDGREPAEVFARLGEDGAAFIVWGEGGAGLPDGAVSRGELQGAAQLVLWTVPPAFSVLGQIIRAVKPEKVYVYAAKPELESPRDYLSHLAGLLKFVVSKRQGLVGREEIAARTGLTEGVADLGIQWLEAKGIVSVERLALEKYKIRMPGSGPVDLQRVAAAEREFGRAWKEVVAFREYFRSCSEAELTDSLRQLE